MKFVVSDLDGSLLKHDKQVSEYTKKVIGELVERGVPFAIATGRGFTSTHKIKTSIAQDMFLICNNGASVYSMTGELIYDNMISKETTIDILKVLEEKNIPYRGFHDDNFYMSKNIIADNTPHDYKVRVLYDIYDSVASDKILIIDENTELLKETQTFLNDIFGDKVTITLSDYNCLDINGKNCSKREGIVHVSNILGYDLSEVMAFGDSENDLAMLSSVGHPVAMKGSVVAKKVKQINETVHTNDEDGVAKYIANYFKL